MPPRVPKASAESYRRRQAMTLAVLVAARRLWAQLSGNWGDSWAHDVGPKVAAVVTAGQIAVAREADSYAAQVLAELGMEVGTSAFRPSSVAGVAGTGDALGVWLSGSVVRAGQSFNKTQDVDQALADGQAWMDQIVQTLMADAARAAESVSLAQREWVDGYVRMLQPPSCSRCVILAGKFYLWNAGFERHPGCDCLHIPAQEEGERFGSMLTNPNTYFDSLSREDQDKAFTKAGAEAIRDGADISQVINARSGMTTTGQSVTRVNPDGTVVNVHRRVAVPTDVFGRDLLVTTAGTTKRGTFGHLEAKRGGDFVGTQVGRRGSVKNYVERRTQRQRLMPEAIYAIANDRADAIRLLKVYGYII